MNYELAFRIVATMIFVAPLLFILLNLASSAMDFLGLGTETIDNIISGFVVAVSVSFGILLLAICLFGLVLLWST